MLDQVDPFLMQLVIVPFFVIGLGVLSSIVSKKVFVGPIVTYILNFLYNFWYFNHYYPDSETDIINYFSWGLPLAIVSLAISWLIFPERTQTKEVRYLKYFVFTLLLVIIGMVFFPFIRGFIDSRLL